MRRVVTSVLVAACLGPVAAAADDPDRFLVDDTSDLVALCEGAGGTDSERQALVFCHGFVVGALHYHLASIKPTDPRRWVCLPELEERPSRDSVIREFVEWAKEHPQFMKEEAVDGLFRFLDRRFPCP